MQMLCVCVWGGGGLCSSYIPLTTHIIYTESDDTHNNNNQKEYTAWLVVLVSWGLHAHTCCVT
jgi:hypothetical protein